MQVKLTQNLEDVKSEKYNTLKSKLYNHIISDSKFPEYKQANLNQQYTELSIKKLQNPTTFSTEQQSQLDSIQSIIDWKDALIAEKDKIKASIDSASSAKEIRELIAGFDYTPIPVEV